MTAKRTRLAPAVVVSLLTIGLWPGVAFADEVTLSDGTVLTGTVLSLRDGVLRLATSYSSPIDIPESGITAVMTEGSVELVLYSGEVLSGTLAAEADGSMVLIADEGGERIPVAMSTVGEINPSATRWSGDVAVGGILVEGNADTLGFSVEGDVTRNAHNNRITAKGRFSLTEANNQQITKNTLATIKYDHYVARRVFIHVSEELFNDRFRDMSLRSVTSVGIGYVVFRRPGRMVEAEIGVSYLAEDFIREVDDQRVALRGAVSLRWPLTPILSFTNDFVVHPSVQGDYQFQIVNQGAFEATLAARWGLKLSFVVHHDSKPPGVTTKSDVHWLLGLQYRF